MERVKGQTSGRDFPPPLQFVNAQRPTFSLEEVEHVNAAVLCCRCQDAATVDRPGHRGHGSAEVMGHEGQTGREGRYISVGLLVCLLFFDKK